MCWYSVNLFLLEKPLTPCEQMLRDYTLEPKAGTYKPVCVQGEFQSTQCDQHEGVCWCVNDLGIERPGTRQKGDSIKCPAPDNPSVLCKYTTKMGTQHFSCDFYKGTKMPVRRNEYYECLNT